MKNLWKMSLVLLVTCALAAGCLAFVYSATKARIEKQALVEKNEALKEVMPEATRFDEVVQGKKWKVYKDAVEIGMVVEVSIQGYGGPIRILFGIDPNRKITRVKILEHNETPGLGAKIREKKFLAQFDGRDKAETALKKDDAQNGKIDALSGATISSRAVTGAVNKGLQEAFEPVVLDNEASLQEVITWGKSFKDISAEYTGIKVWAAFDGEKEVGKVIETTAKGYAGPIVVMFGLSDKKKITGIKIISHKEAGGIGSAIDRPDFLWQFRNRSAKEAALKADDPVNGKIDAVSGATASARAVTQAVRDAIALVK